MNEYCQLTLFALDVEAKIPFIIDAFDNAFCHYSLKLRELKVNFH